MRENDGSMQDAEVFCLNCLLIKLKLFLTVIKP